MRPRYPSLPLSPLPLTSSLPALLALAALLSAAPAAQTGPWKDGEIVARMNPGGGFQNLIHRIDPVTGNGALLADVTYLGPPGSATFDSYRNGVLAVCSVAPDHWAVQSLWLFASDGAATKLGLTGLSPGALAPTGDGRVFYQRKDVLGNAQIEWIDASNVSHVLLDAAGAAPFEQYVEVMIYSPSQNALFAAISEQGGAWSCGGTSLASIFRIPLSADGTRVGGAVSCSTYDGFGTEHPTNFDVLPGGDLLLTFCSSFIAAEKLRRVDPATGANSLFALCNPHDIDGGLWSPALNRVIVCNDSTNQLETYAVGGDGTGVALPTSVPVSGFTSGTGPGNVLFPVRLGGPGCAGLLQSYGPGLAGHGGLVPRLAAAGCADVGQGFAILIDDVVGAASGLLFIGLSQADVPFKGGKLLVGGIALQIPITVSGAPGTPGDGFLSIPAVVPDPSLIGIDIFLQAGFSDLAAINKVSLTNGLRVQAG